MKINSQNTNINLRHLRALQAVAQEGSFARAADQLGIVPSALSEVIRQLEDAAGIALFDRRMRPPVLTPEGLAFLSDAQPALQQLDLALERLHEASDLARGRLNVGASPSAIATWVAPAIRQFRHDHPAISIGIHDSPAEKLAQMVIEGTLDLAVGGYAGASPLLELTQIATDPFGLAVHAGHALARRDSQIQLSDIEPAELIHLDDDTGTARLLRADPLLPERYKGGTLRAHSTFGQLCLIRSGVGIALLPRNAVTIFEDPGLVFLPIGDLRLERRISLITPSKRPISHAARRFITLLGLGEISEDAT